MSEMQRLGCHCTPGRGITTSEVLSHQSSFGSPRTDALGTRVEARAREEAEEPGMEGGSVCGADSWAVSSCSETPIPNLSICQGELNPRGHRWKGCCRGGNKHRGQRLIRVTGSPHAEARQARPPPVLQLWSMLINATPLCTHGLLESPLHSGSLPVGPDPQPATRGCQTLTLLS